MHFYHGQWVDHDNEPIDMSEAPTAGEPQVPEQDDGTEKAKRTRSAKKDPREGKGDA